MMEIGRNYRAKPMFTSFVNAAGGVPKGAESSRTAMYGKCVFIHPKGRFVTLEFAFGKDGNGHERTIRESFGMEELI